MYVCYFSVELRAFCLLTPPAKTEAEKKLEERVAALEAETLLAKAAAADATNAKEKMASELATTKNLLEAKTKDYEGLDEYSRDLL